jgi:toxin FitB
LRVVDTSIAVAAFGEWNVLNVEACDILDEGAAIPVHALLETYSVLTGFPPPHRAAPDLVDEWISSRFSEVLPAPSVDDQRALITSLAGAGRIGGSIYDGLIALTVKLGKGVLKTADLRAGDVYDLVGVEWELVTPG